MVQTEKIFDDDDIRDGVKEIYQALGEVAGEISKELHMSSKFTVEASLEMLSEENYDDRCTLRVKVTNNGY